jgi:Domain of unknown function (DUF4345)
MKIAFKIVVSIMVLIPLVTGFKGVLRGFRNIPNYKTLDKSQLLFLDNEWRFFLGIWLGMGIAFLLVIYDIKKFSILFQVLIGCIIIGGIGRLISWYILKEIRTDMLVFTIIELVLCPLILLWHSYLFVNKL